MTFFVHDVVELIGKHAKIRATMKQKNMGTEIAASSRRFHNSQVSHASIIHLKMYAIRTNKQRETESIATYHQPEACRQLLHH